MNDVAFILLLMIFVLQVLFKINMNKVFWLLMNLIGAMVNFEEFLPFVLYFTLKLKGDVMIYVFFFVMVGTIIWYLGLVYIIALYLIESTLKFIKIIINVAEEITFLCTLLHCGFELKRLYLFEH